MVNKLAAWKKRQDPPLSTNQLAEILGASPGWISTLLNQSEESLERRCSYDLALKIWLLTKGEVQITDMMTPPAEIKTLRKEILRMERHVKSS